jgi:hypothetical protein
MGFWMGVVAQAFPELQKSRQEDCECETNLGYKVRLYLKKTKKRK